MAKAQKNGKGKAASKAEAKAQKAARKAAALAAEQPVVADAPVRNPRPRSPPSPATRASRMARSPPPARDDPDRDARRRASRTAAPRPPRHARRDAVALTPTTAAALAAEQPTVADAAPARPRPTPAPDGARRRARRRPSERRHAARRHRPPPAAAAATRPPPSAAATKPAATATTRAPRRRGSDTNGVARPEPTLTIVETRILRGPNYWAREPVIRQVVDLGVLEEFPSNKIPGFVDALVGDAARRSRTTRAASAGAAGSSRGSAKGPGRATSPSTSRSSSRTSPGTDVRHGKTRGTGEYGRYNVVFEYREEQVGHRGRADGRRAREPPRRALGRGVRVRPHGGAREAHPARRAARVRAEHPGAPRRGRRPRHPVHPARPVQPRPAGPGRPPAAHPRDDDQPRRRASRSTSRATRS